jgi:transposase
LLLYSQALNPIELAFPEGGMSDAEWLGDEAWAVIEPHLPKGRLGAPRVDDRRVISGILHVLRSGCRWRDCPPAFGPATTIYNRYNRWSAQGFWRRLFERLAAAGTVACTSWSDPSAIGQSCP